MAGLQWQLQPVENEDSAILAELSGAIDGNTVPSFQQMLEEIKSKGVRRLVLDMSKIKYVNSTGLGSLVKYADSFKNSGGGMALIKVPAKVKIVIEMLGLNAFFDICAGLPEALAALESKGGGAPPQREQPAPKPPQGNKPPLVQAPMSQSGAVRPVAPPQAAAAPASRQSGVLKPLAQAAATSASASSGAKSGFPVYTVCSVCTVQLEFKDAGNWKCPRCGASALVRGDGSVSVTRSDKPATLTLSLTAGPECGEGLFHLVTTVCGTVLAQPSLEAVRFAVHEVANVLTSVIYANNPNGVYHVAIDRSQGRVQLRFSDAGSAINSQQIGQFFPNASRQMDEFECRPHPTGTGNVIRMSKNG